MKFDLQVNNRTFEIRIIFSNDDGYLFDVYEHISKKHWWSSNRRYLFNDACVHSENIKKDIIDCINGYLEQEKIYNNFIEQVAELSK